ncbi:unnamed protein product [Calypogeia fissa]
MTKGGARPHCKRVSAAAKERRCGVPCTLLVAAWTLFLLLLLTSSISHEDGECGPRGYSYTERLWAALFWSSQASSSSIHAFFGPERGRLQGHHEHYCRNQLVDFRNGQHMERGNADKIIFPGFAVLEELDDFATQELTGASLDGRSDHPDFDGEDFISSVDSSSDEKSVPVPESDGELHLSHLSIDKLESEHSSGVVLPTRIVFQEFGEPIDALQYAEYGAGLLQKSGPSEDKSRICLIRSAGGTNCRVSSHHRELSGQNCIWLPQECAEGQDQPLPKDDNVEERCYDASSYERDLVAQVGPGGGSYLVCQTDVQFERIAVCGVSCNTQSECLLPGVESTSDSSRRDLISETHQEGQEQPEVATSKAEESQTSDLPDSVEFEGIQPPQQQDEELSSSVDIDSGSNYLSQQDVVERVEKAEDGNADEIPQHCVNVEDDTAEIKVLDARVEEMDADVEFLSPLVTTDAAGRDSLVDPAEDVVREERDFGDEILLVELELLLEEPRRLKRVGSVMSLDEYKRSILESQRTSGKEVDLSTVQAQKVRYSDESYNYASATHGAKLLASNKEAKGASHILTSDKDKYLRNPCGAEDKHVVIELSEETFVDTVFISNFEFHSSNLKDFEVLGSTVYPTKDWISIGKFQAENVRHRQKFTIEDPKMVRHLMIKMLTHWGSEFFCTLSIVEVFGVDVIKNLLDDWIALDEVDNNARTQGSNGSGVSQEEVASLGGTGHKLDSDATLDDLLTEELIKQSEMGTGSDQGGGTVGRDTSKAADGLHGDEDSKAGGSTGDSSAQEVTHPLGGKPAGDSVLKILMQRVKALELNQTLFDLYLGDMNQKYKVMLSELDKDLALVTQRLRNETALTASLAMRLADRELQRKEERQYMEHRFAQIASNFTDNLDMMRWQIQSMERREITAILLSFLCMILSALLHLLASCLPRRNHGREIPARTSSTEVKEEIKQEVEAELKEEVKEEVVDSTSGGIDSKLVNLSLSNVCRCSSNLILYLACGLTILVLSV